jgi:hypothetical protein
MLLMDRENLMVPGWSHVLSSTNDLAELEALCLRLGVPRRAIHLRPGRPHVDLKLWARDLALHDPAIRVFATTRELLKAWAGCQVRGPGSRV